MRKRCPECRESIQIDAVVCGFCGYSIRPGAGWSLVAVAGSLAIAAPVVIYAMRLAYWEYYRAFGVNVDEVGLSHWRMFGLTGVGIIPLAFILATIVGLPVGCALVAKRRLHLEGLGTFFLALFFLFLWFVPLLLIDAMGWADWSALILLLPLGLVPLVVPFLSESTRVHAVRSLRIPKQLNVVGAAQTISRVVWFVLIGVLVGTWTIVWLNAFETAQTLNPDGTTSANGRADKSMADFVLGVLDSRPSPVCILRLSGDQIPDSKDSEIDLGDPKLMLGSADGVTVLYELSAVDDANGYVLRVPTSQVVLGPAWISLDGLTCEP